MWSWCHIRGPSVCPALYAGGEVTFRRDRWMPVEHFETSDLEFKGEELER